MSDLIDKLFRIFYVVAYRVLLCLWYILKPTTRGVYIAVWNNRKILIIKNSYRKTYTCPSGGIKQHEKGRAAAVRELREEVGLSVEPDRLRFAGEYTCRNEFKQDTVSFFEIRFPVQPPVKKDNREVIWAKFMDVEKAMELPLSPLLEAYLKDYAATKQG